MRKHQFINPKEQPMPDLAPLWVGYVCEYCGEISGLDAWQIMDMPKEMAECSKSPKKPALSERLSGCYNCMKDKD